MAGWLPGKQEAAERVSAYVAAAIADLNERLERARANARHELELDLQSAWVDDTAAGARRTSYKLGHDRSFHATCRRLEALQKARRAGGETMADELDDETGIETETETEPAGAAVVVADAETGPAVEPTAELPVTVTSAPISAPPDEAIVTVTNEPISGGPTGQSFKSETRNPKSETDLKPEVQNLKQVTECGVVMPASYAELSENGSSAVTNEPISPGTVDRREETVDPVRWSPSPAAGAYEAFEWRAEARGMPPLDRT
jgi:hypothetical protein